MSHWNTVSFNLTVIFDSYIYYILNCYEPQFENLWMNLMQKIRILYLRIKKTHGCKFPDSMIQLYKNVGFRCQKNRQQQTEYTFIFKIKYNNKQNIPLFL